MWPARVGVDVELARDDVIGLGAGVADLLGAMTIESICSVSMAAVLMLKAKTFSLARAGGRRGARDVAGVVELAFALGGDEAGVVLAEALQALAGGSGDWARQSAPVRRGSRPW